MANLKGILFRSAKTAREEINKFGEHNAIGESASRTWWVLDALLEKAGLMSEFEAWERNAVEASTEEWGHQEKSVTLTNRQWNRLVCYITMSTKFREGELEAWQRLAEEKCPDGQPAFPNAPEQATYWQGIIKDLEDIKAAIDAA